MLAVVAVAVVSAWVVLTPSSHPSKTAGAVDRPPAGALQSNAGVPTTTPSTAASKSHAPKPRPAVTRWPYGKCPAAAEACVDLKHKVTWLQRNGVVFYGPVPMEPGSPGQVTPVGNFQVAWKDEHHVSNEFNEPMPYAVFFAPGGIAFHVGSLTKGSHGCVHLTTKSAAYYFDQLQPGAGVSVF